LIQPSATRERLTADMYLSNDADDPVNLIERALTATIGVQPVETKIRAATRDGRLAGALPPGAGVDALVDRAKAAGVITADEGAALIAARALMEKVIRVDDFAADLGISLFQFDASPAVSVSPATTSSQASPPRQRAVA